MSLKCVFLGYEENVKGYTLWVREEMGYKVIIRRDVVFNESLMPCLKETKLSLYQRDVRIEVEPSNLNEGDDLEVRNNLNQPENVHIVSYLEEEMDENPSDLVTFLFDEYKLTREMEKANKTSCQKQ
ncbi:Reverse transcriptase Ty1/copia-type domain-containing protein [Abeliophyllum distichum]|uniref:Reverse transcriptase Ty1/copia-type domain-containing protein n=1 Tax=Abeliophyllum distichum TaxID=126358 RepID=A0ABD1U3U4_9LAMI